jgi:drug/metabolite transporter (DMT)-like permease
MWLLATIGSYFINGGVYVADKFLLSKKIHSSITYAFYVGIWSVFNLVLLIFDPYVPSAKWLLIELSAGGLFLFTMVFWYKALHQSEATRVVPIVGALVPLFSLVLSFFLLGEKLDKRHLLAFIILIAGGVLISIKNTKLHYPGKALARIEEIMGKIHARYRPTQDLVFNSMVSAFFFSLYYVFMKYIYSFEPFLGSFVWSRLGTFVGVMIIFLVPSWRDLIRKHQKGMRREANMIFFMGVRVAAALAFIILNWAISLGNVAMVNALQGTQFLFLILLVLLLSNRYPWILKEELGKGVLVQKMIGIVFVSIGLYILM